MSRKEGKSRQVPKKRVNFRLSAPDAKSVFVCGDFNGWDTQARSLKLGAKGIWRTHTSLEPGVYAYRFVVDGEWRNDPEAETTPNPHGSLDNVLTVS